MLSLQQAVDQGIERLCAPSWGGNVYIKLHVTGTPARLVKIVGYDYKSKQHELTMNAWPATGQEMPFDSAGSAVVRWLPFIGAPSPYEA